MAIISKIDYKIYKKFDKVAYFGSIMLLAAVAIPGLGWSAGGATRWINLKFTTFQPSEIAKIALVIFYATYLTNNRDKLGNLWEGFIRPFLFLVPIIGILILVQSHLSATVLIVLIVTVMMIMAGSKIRYFITFGSMAAIGGGGLLYILAKKFDIGAYRLARLTAFTNPWADPTNTGWQIIQSLYAIGSGGLFGVGLGNSTQKYLYLPEPQNDFIFAVIAEELGFVRLYNCNSTLCDFCMERSTYCYEGARYVWKFTCNRNYINNWTSSFNKYSSCYIFYAKYRDAASIL